MKVLVCIFVCLISVFCGVDILNAQQDSSSVDFNNRKENVVLIEKKQGLLLQESVFVYDSASFVSRLNLKKQQQKKIDKLYKKYLKQQLKVKNKLELLIVDLDDLGQNVDVEYDSFELETEIDKVYNLKAELFFNNYVFLKKVERILKKQQVDTYLEMVSFYYEVDI